MPAVAQITASRTRDLTPQEKKSAIEFLDISSAHIMTVRGKVATFAESGLQHLSAQVVWYPAVFNVGLCVAQVSNASAERKVGETSIKWEYASISHHLPPGLSYLAWRGSTSSACKAPPDNGVVSVYAPISNRMIRALIDAQTRIKNMARPLLLARTAGKDNGSSEKLLAASHLRSIDVAFSDLGFVYELNYATDDGCAGVKVQVSDSLDQLRATWAGIWMC